MNISNMNEWEFTADIASRINGLIESFPELPFSQARCEQKGEGSRKRRDLTLLDKNKRVCLTGEIKLPYAKDGSSPYNATVVADARKKALRAASPYFFTWNVNEFVLWETKPAETAQRDLNYKSWTIASVTKESHLDHPETQEAIRKWTYDFLHDYARIRRGTSPIGYKPPDEKFIDALESALHIPIQLTIEALYEKYQDPRIRAQLDKWMRDEQGWTIYRDPEGIRDNLTRAAKFTCYSLVNKLVFHEALLEQYKSGMHKLQIAGHINTGEDLRMKLESAFHEAKTATGDYETVFGEEHLSLGNRIPFYSNTAVAHWRDLINQIHEFDFSKLDYEVIGNIFERLISPEERHKYGQFYTRVEVVDLINSFCIHTGDELVMDPACGGGTFLVRAYARKKELQPARKHSGILSELFGVDVSYFATHLTTINLATRELVNEANYPRIVRGDFFNVMSGKTFLTLPKRAGSTGLGKKQREVDIPRLDAVIGNPPYIRQEEIPKATIKKTPDPGTKEHYQKVAREEGGIILSGRSDIHCYFWPHAASFLKEDGYLCFLTSSQWLDVEYGFRLQEWILKNFEIVAIFESRDEPWFVGARVTTTITILRRQADQEQRMNNIVRFVQLRSPMKELLAHDGTTAGAVVAANDFRDEILGLRENVSNSRYRARLVAQGDLWREGVRLGKLITKSNGGEDHQDTQNGDYYGGKWGVHLRAPDVWFQLLDKYDNKFSTLSEIVDVRFGIKSGKDNFFFPKDISDNCLLEITEPHIFKDVYGVNRKDVENGTVSLVLCGEGRGQIHAIESKYLEPEVHSLMEIHSYTVSPDDCSRKILLIDKPYSEIKDKYVKKYIKWGEENEIHKSSTCAARATATRAWYDLTGHKRGALFWPMAQQYKHIIPENPQNLICNHNLFDVTPKCANVNVIGGILNSTWVILSKYQFGRPVGVEGNLKTEVIDVKMMMVPDPSKATKKAIEKVEKAYIKLKQREPLNLLSQQRLKEMSLGLKCRQDEIRRLSGKCEFDMEDRYDLDDAVLEMIGVRNSKDRSDLIFRLYQYLRSFFENVRDKEEKAIENKKRTKRKDRNRPADIAEEIYLELKEKHHGFVKRYIGFFSNMFELDDTYEIPEIGEPEIYSDMYVPHGVIFKSGRRKAQIIATRNQAQSELLVLVVNSGERVYIRVPFEEKNAKKVFKLFEKAVNDRDRIMRKLIAERTADEELQEKIYSLVLNMILNR